MKDRQPRSALAVSSFIVALLGPIATALRILCLTFFSSLSGPARDRFAWVVALVCYVVGISLYLTLPLALTLGTCALLKIKKATHPVKGRGLARAAIALSVLTSAFLASRVPADRTAYHSAATNACVSGNLSQIEMAKDQWAMLAGVTNGPVDLPGILGYFKGSEMPICPGGGKYTIGNIEELPRCSLHGTTNDRYCPKWWE